MMSFDVHPSEAAMQGDIEDKFSHGMDARLQRDAQKDLHEAVDLAFMFAKAIKALHPMAEKHVKIMIIQGSLL